ncbi:MAG TPA: carboxypeptidase regulatory-like domain-containing protein, partial [Gammaproteobacteria bacterium]
NEELELPQHWFFDAHLIDRGWREPRCVTVCATGALKAVKVTDEEMAAIKSREGLNELQPELATKPRVHYKNLYRYTHEFVGGTVIKTVAGVTDCVANARIKLESSGSVVGEAVTDAYGEFKIDGLPPDSGRYGVVIEVDGRVSKRLDVELGKSVYLGRIDLGA